MPLVPAHIGRLIKENRLDMVVQPSAQRTFTEDELRTAGIPLQDDLSDCDLVMGVKEIPVAQFSAGKAYVFFSHTIKGQDYNMGMLQDLMAKGCSLIDYECIVDEQDRRLVAFGVHAGLAGMVDSIWSLGQRLKVQGVDSPLAALKPAVKCGSLEAAKADLHRAAVECKNSGALKSLGPVVFGIAGNGRVSKGAQEISSLLSPRKITPEQLLAGEANEDGVFYQVVFTEEHMAKPKDGSAFDLQTYYKSPELFEGAFAQYLPYLTTLVNCIYWEDRFPRLVTQADLQSLYAGEAKLKVIGDISCDIDGSIEATVKPTNPGNPTFVYDVKTGEAHDGFEGHGPLVMAVEILPTEIPRESSLAFGEALFHMMPDLANSDMSGDFESWNPPAALKRATIVYKGELTERFAYIAESFAK
jgi:saccharopine dehydrogenase (NAD+, L-lysine-forming)